MPKNDSEEFLRLLFQYMRKAMRLDITPTAATAVANVARELRQALKEADLHAASVNLSDKSNQELLSDICQLSGGRLKLVDRDAA